MLSFFRPLTEEEPMEYPKALLSSISMLAVVCLLVFGCSILNDDDGDGSSDGSTSTTTNPAGSDGTSDGTSSGTSGSTSDPEDVVDASSDESSIMGSIDTSTASVVPTSPYEGDASGSSTAIASDPVSDGSAARLALNGSTQYFYGLLSDQADPVPVVKIINSVNQDVVDVAVIFSPDFTDLTWGENGIGWGNRSWNHVVTSDHVELQFLNGNGDVVLHAKFDLISADPTGTASSGYAALGLGGDGEIISGDASNILSFGTSMDDNLNYFGYDDASIFESSPATDSTFKANPQYPNWQYYAVYRVTLDADAFGSSGYGGVQMTTVHSSPAKSSQETVEVTQGDPPEAGSPDDPFRYFTPTTPDTGTTTPPDTTSTDSTSQPSDSLIPG
jgi:hypothetical protein